MRSSRALWVGSALFIVYGATIPFHFSGDRAAVIERARHVTLSPFVSSDTGRRLSTSDVVQNVLLFLPFGALGMLGARPGRHGWRFVAVTALGLTLSSGVESVQLLTADRVSSVADIVANTVGTAAGALALWWSRRAIAAAMDSLRGAGLADVPELRPLAIAAAVVGISFLQPFDVTLDVSIVVGKVRALQADIWQFTGLRDEGTSVIISVFFATTLASYLSTLGEKRAALKAIILGAGCVWMLEGSQLFITSRAPGIWDAGVSTLGIAIGAAIWAGSARVLWPRLWLSVIVIATFVAAALQMLSPFDLAPAYQTFGWFPFLGYYSHTTFETLSHVVELMLLYFPLGFWLGSGAGRFWGALAWAAGLTLAIAMPIEYLQGWVAGRYPDLSDVAMSLCGGLAGVMIGLDRNVIKTESLSNIRHSR